ncbi:uncharacterized protein M6B38_367990 [Iris pallida]|uniref:Isopenicillin N synthase-like Fe(2+) 2OG dioxygenase domain-containing protein n=1 Tax=Iris pallida TaxID=29817 RepID=A0AAX6GG48_IRIPA|nr:uncharacterized protein M6B38_142785 [Iris pallida]KAJ6827171.1 uncharacterized protein M6B38_367990 [Iris pallida]
MDAEAEILIPYSLQFSDLLFLSSAGSPSTSEELERLRSVTDSVMESLGPSGPGLLSIVGVPRTERLRRDLLHFARRLALLEKKDRARILKEHGLGSDVPLKNPDRNVSSFALQLKYQQNQSLAPFSSCPCNIEEVGGIAEDEQTVHGLQDLIDQEFKQLGKTFKGLGHCMMELGLMLAQVCDKAIGEEVLVQSIVRSCTAKGRLIHYHSLLDNLILKEVNRSKGFRKKVGPGALTPSLSHGFSRPKDKAFLEAGMGTVDEPVQLDNLHSENGSTEARRHRTYSDLWQQWHYDYGIFTVLTMPLFLSATSVEDGIQECISPDGHTYLQLYDSSKNKVLLVKSLPESFIIQVGEAADILSHGKLRPTLHSVGKPLEFENLSRETFVVFLQPSWDQTLSYSEHLNCRSNQEYLSSSKGTCNKEDPLNSVVVGSQEPFQLMQGILRKIPPLSSRLRDGMTFAEFARETTKQYYGGSGIQSRDK